ncbi:hypothetical protein BMS3Bbin06_00390 [bacterium BMS3Bbin06]|nr:hypothetical protein BMS3Abin08_01887 [bacterium BMS3Abin08]GBE33875.1 hypothetical protein BMS3Bbin06_00390 [bacterium BMS3Bbin06]HDO34879.1 hypothetical protein [Nitrospirota bacterium]
MTILPSQINSMLKLYAKLSRSNSSLLDSTSSPLQEVDDVVEISNEAKRRQINEDTKMEVIKKIKETVGNAKGEL